MTESNVEEEHNRAKEYAKEKGYILNPDERKLETVLRGLARNKERFGAAYCPCRLRSGDPRNTGSSSAPASTTSRR